jgi:hypothetical protein
LLRRLILRALTRLGLILRVLTRLRSLWVLTLLGLILRSLALLRSRVLRRLTWLRLILGGLTWLRSQILITGFVRALRGLSGLDREDGIPNGNLLACIRCLRWLRCIVVLRQNIGCWVCRLVALFGRVVELVRTCRILGLGLRWGIGTLCGALCGRLPANELQRRSWLRSRAGCIALASHTPVPCQVGVCRRISRRQECADWL